jgi:NAD+ kinase
VIVVARDPAPHVQNAWRALETVLRTRPGIELLAAATDDDAPADPGDAEAALVLGGDGAILRACRQFGHAQKPILGINLGRLGFLADLTPDEFRHCLPRLEARDFRIVHHLMFVCELLRGDGRCEQFLGLNEVSLLAGGSLSMIDVQLAIDGEVVTTYSGDGLIVSTPVGSTAHSLSAGGPILTQDLHAFVVTPICPHTLTNRPLVEHADREYMLAAPRAPQGVMLVVDGQVRTPFGPHDRAVIRRAPFTFQRIRLPGHSYYQALHRKLGWGGQPRYQQRS